MPYHHDGKPFMYWINLVLGYTIYSDEDEFYARCYLKTNLQRFMQLYNVLRILLLCNNSWCCFRVFYFACCCCHVCCCCCCRCVLMRKKRFSVPSLVLTCVYLYKHFVRVLLFSLQLSWNKFDTGSCMEPPFTLVTGILPHSFVSGSMPCTCTVY